MTSNDRKKKFPDETNRKYFMPPTIHNGFYYSMIMRLNIQTLTIFKYNSHNSHIEEEEIDSKLINEQTVLNCCSHYMHQNYQDVVEIYIFNVIASKMSFCLTINTTNDRHTIKTCINTTIIHQFSLLLQDPMIQNVTPISICWTTLLPENITIWQLRYDDSFHIMTQHSIMRYEFLNTYKRSTNKLSFLISQLHKQKKFTIIEDPVYSNQYLIYYNNNGSYLKSSKNQKMIFIIKLASNKNPTIQQYNIRKVSCLDLVIYHGQLFFLSKLSQFINILSLTRSNKIGKIKTNICESRFKMHFVLRQRVSGVHYVSIFAGRNTPHEISYIIDNYMQQHFKWELILFNRYTNGNIIAPITINMHEAIYHLNSLCLI